MKLPIAAKGLHPAYAHAGDAGADLRSLTGASISAGGFATIRTGLQLAIPEGHFGMVVGRSGLGVKHGISVLNGVGIIDSGYRGEILVGLINHGKKPFSISSGDRIAQLVIVPFVTAAFENSFPADPTERGEGGLGSTGISS